MEALTLDKATKLYEILGAYIPDVEDEDISALEFIGKIVENIQESEQHKDYVDAVMLMSGKEWEEVKTLKSEEVLNLFIDGLTTNRVVSLKTFFSSIGFGHARS